MKRVLITGGPVHCYLDAVKIITNRFKGGLMAELAENLLAKGAEVHYLCASDLEVKMPRMHPNLTIHWHKGFTDYECRVLEISPKMDGVILGAAVANLIPVETIKGKFPSHNYKPGDVIPINFTIAPRIIDEVKKVAPKTHLFGFKLLSGVEHEELIRAAYEIVLSAGATAVIANDAKQLKDKHAVTKERAIHQMENSKLADWIMEMLNDEYYETEFSESRLVSACTLGSDDYLAIQKMRAIIGQYSDKFVTVENEMIFGTVAVRTSFGFMTTGRGKKELNSFVPVLRVDDQKRQVVVAGPMKASLNAPLLARIFENPRVDHIVHYHQQEPDLPTEPYAPPGTVRDSSRPTMTSFNIAAHGCMLLFNKNGERI